MVALGADWAPLVVEDLVELIMRLFIITWSAIHGANSIIWLALARGVLLVARPSMVTVALPIVVVDGVGSGCALVLLHLPSAASCHVDPPPFWGDYA